MAKGLSSLCGILASAVFLVLLASCAVVTGQPGGSPNAVTDQLGRAVTVDRIPQRIISLAPGNTEILFALGLADRVVAVTDYCNYPPEASSKPSIGGFSTPNIEEIVALSPDMVLAASIHEQRVIPQLESKGLTVLALSPETLDGVLEAIALVGQVTGEIDRASGLAAMMQDRLRMVTDKTADLAQERRPPTCYIVWHDPLMIAGPKTLQDELIAKAGGANIGMLSSQSGYIDISLETLIMANPAVIIIGSSHGSNEDQTFQYVVTEPRLKDTDALRNNRVFAIDSDLASRPGPRIIEALEQFAAFIHPDLFRQVK